MVASRKWCHVPEFAPNLLAEGVASPAPKFVPPILEGPSRTGQNLDGPDMDGQILSGPILSGRLLEADIVERPLLSGRVLEVPSTNTQAPADDDIGPAALDQYFGVSKEERPYWLAIAAESEGMQAMAAMLTQMTARLEDLAVRFDRSKSDLMRAGHEIGLLQGRLLAQEPLVNQVPELRVQAAKAIGLSVQNRILQEKVEALEAEIAQLRGSQPDFAIENILPVFRWPSLRTIDTMLMPLVVLLALFIVVGTTVIGLHHNWWM